MSIDLVAAIATKALDGLFARQAATADNIANAGSAGFTPVRVSFEDALRTAALPRPGDNASGVMNRIVAVEPMTGTTPADQFDGMKLDREITTASETSARYAMLVSMLDRTLQMQQLAVKGV
ncbi:flagellar basal body rod protein FlgB [Paraburkholderia sp. IW21]|uniref:flagellar basal body rod protein FlgB n=1 Tax=Paraburkholderia sp. IW21 TaxID=3242488 RepID=UPI0035221BF7